MARKRGTLLGNIASKLGALLGLTGGMTADLSDYTVKKEKPVNPNRWDRDNHFTQRERERHRENVRRSEEGRKERLLAKGHGEFTYEDANGNPHTVIALNDETAWRKFQKASR